MTIHNCPDCGLVHDHGAPQVNPEVEIARINADNALRIAQLSARTDKHVAEVTAESAVEVTEAQADGDVAVAEIVAPELSPAAPPDVEPAPVVIAEDPGPVDDTPEVEAPPEADVQHEHAPRKRGLGMWQ